MLIASYNIQWGTGKDGRVDLDRIAGDLAGAEVIALQEVDRFWTRSHMTDQAAEIARLFADHHWVYGPALDLDADGDDPVGRAAHRRRQFGNMVLSRHPILSTRTHPLPKLHLPEALSLHRSALEAVIAWPTGPVRIDYAFLSPDLQGKARAMRVDHQAQGSDHQPIWLELDL